MSFIQTILSHKPPRGLWDPPLDKKQLKQKNKDVRDAERGEEDLCKEKRGRVKQNGGKEKRKEKIIGANRDMEINGE